MASKSIMPLTDRQRADFDRLVRSKPVLLFMKGNRRFPACGFSATVVGILDKLTSGYETVNILEDPQVRDGMKEFSSWPTFPQLYVEGEFVGGCDIVKEMYASGELQKLLGRRPPAPVSAPRVTLSPAAAKALLDAAADAGGEVIRLAIDGEFRCELQIAARQKDDIEVRSSGAVLFVERTSAARADGIHIDFVESPGGMAFKIRQPERATARQAHRGKGAQGPPRRRSHPAVRRATRRRAGRSRHRAGEGAGGGASRSPGLEARLRDRPALPPRGAKPRRGEKACWARDSPTSTTSRAGSTRGRRRSIPSVPRY